MIRICDPVHVQHPRLQEFAVQAAYVDKLGGGLQDMVMLCDDLPEHERLEPAEREGWYEEVDAMAVAVHFLTMAYDSVLRDFEEFLAMWLGEDPEHWPTMRLVLLTPWQQEDGSWDEEAPAWVRLLGTLTTAAHEKFDPFGRRPTR